MIILMLEDYSANGKTFFKGEKYIVGDTFGATLVSGGYGTTVLEKKVHNVITIDDDYTVTIDDEIILADATAALAITLPTAADVKGLPFTIKKIGTGTDAVTFTADGGTITLDTVNDVCTIISDGISYLVLSSNIA